MISDCSGRISGIFFKDTDGNIIPFTGIDTTEITEYVVKKYNFPPESLYEPVELSFTLTNRTVKKLRKMINTDVNRQNRKKRRYYRKKEKIRRKMLALGYHGGLYGKAN